MLVIKIQRTSTMFTCIEVAQYFVFIKFFFIIDVRENYKPCRCK